MRGLKNKTAFNAEMKKMDDSVYELRSKVMKVIYEAKSRGFNLPRVEVRIVSGGDACGYAYLGKNIVHMNEAYVNNPMLTQIVLHEIVHAVFGVGETVGCRLMHCSKFWENKPSVDDAWQIFETYYKSIKH